MPSPLPDPEFSYNTLVAFLHPSTCPTALPEFEILPSSLLPSKDTTFICDDRSIGISKPLLIAAFLHAKRVFASSNALLATAVILLYDPDHVTALNARKRALMVPDQDLTASLRDEFWLLDALQRSPLRKHPKSSNLWYHRAWLLSQFPSHMLSLCDDFLGQQMSSIFIAAAQHPQNYNAWAYARVLHTFASEVSAVDVSEVEFVLPTRGFCLQHIRDTSAWSFMTFLARSEHRSDEHGVDSKEVQSTVNVVIDAAFKLQYSTAPIWLFVAEVLSTVPAVSGEFRRTSIERLKLLIVEEETRGSIEFMKRVRDCINIIYKH